jgi:hypothetical protein
MRAMKPKARLYWARRAATDSRRRTLRLADFSGDRAQLYRPRFCRRLHRGAAKERWKLSAELLMIIAGVGLRVAAFVKSLWRPKQRVVGAS